MIDKSNDFKSSSGFLDMLAVFVAILFFISYFIYMIVFFIAVIWLVISFVCIKWFGFDPLLVIENLS